MQETFNFLRDINPNTLPNNKGNMKTAYQTRLSLLNFVQSKHWIKINLCKTKREDDFKYGTSNEHMLETLMKRHEQTRYAEYLKFDIAKFMIEHYHLERCKNNAVDRSEPVLVDDIKDNWHVLESMLEQLCDDINAVYIYRQYTDYYSYSSFKKWFPYITSNDAYKIYAWLDFERDYIFTAAGMNTMIHRYLKPNEPIQFALLRIARNFAYKNGKLSFDDWSLFYRLLSCGFLHVSSILAAADISENDDCCGDTRPGEACRLLVAHPDNGKRFMKQLLKINQLIDTGVGVGIGAQTIPKYGSNEPNRVREGFKNVVQRLESLSYVSMYDRKPKVALYIGIHNDTIFECLTMKNPTRINHIEHCFFGLMISDHFMNCVRKNEYWHLFPADACIGRINLSETFGDEYERLYKEMVSRHMYSYKIEARKLMSMIVKSIGECGNPYIIFDDHVNRYNNQYVLGKVKTLNLCAEITNYSDENNSSSCTLMSVNMGYAKEFPNILNDLYRKLIDDLIKYDMLFAIKQFELNSYEMYAFAMGYFSTLGLNNLMGYRRRRRELAVTPLGMYDMALMFGVDPIKCCASAAEALYMGCVVASIVYNRRHSITCANFEMSAFKYGQLQFDLRKIKPTFDWSQLSRLMIDGMANSMLTAQAPTATTSLLTGMTESVTLPIDNCMIRETANGRSYSFNYGLISRFLQNLDISCVQDGFLQNDLKNQVEMYRVSAPFVDHSQSTIFSIDLSPQSIFNVIRETYLAKLKTGIYYCIPKSKNNILSHLRMDTPSKLYIDYLDELKCYKLKNDNDEKPQSSQMTNSIDMKMDENTDENAKNDTILSTSFQNMNIDEYQVNDGGIHYRTYEPITDDGGYDTVDDQKTKSKVLVDREEQSVYKAFYLDTMIESNDSDVQQATNVSNDDSIELAGASGIVRSDLYETKSGDSYSDDVFESVSDNEPTDNDSYCEDDIVFHDSLSVSTDYCSNCDYDCYIRNRIANTNTPSDNTSNDYQQKDSKVSTEDDNCGIANASANGGGGGGEPDYNTTEFYDLGHINYSKYNKCDGCSM